MNYQSILQYASPGSLRNSAKCETTQSYICLQFTREQSSLFFNQAANIFLIRTFALLTGYPLSNHRLSLVFECPARFFIYQIILYTSSGSKSAYHISSRCTENTPCFPTLRCSFLEKYHCPELIFNSFLVWICVRHT